MDVTDGGPRPDRPPKPPQRKCRYPDCDREPYPPGKDWAGFCREHSVPETLDAIREARPTPVEPEARRHHPNDNCGDPNHDAILEAWYARANAMLDRLEAANAGLELNGIEEERDRLARPAVEPDGLPLDVPAVERLVEAANAVLYAARKRPVTQQEEEALALLDEAADVVGARLGPSEDKS